LIWNKAAGAPGVLTFVDNDQFGAGIDRVRVYLPRALSPTGPLFARLAVFINYTPENLPPVANAQSITVDEDAMVPITLTGSDTDFGSLAYTVIDQPLHGILGGTPPNLTYTPNENYFGADSFTFKVNDGTVDSPAATVSITVNPLAEFNQWMSGFGLSAGPETDSDGYGISNAVEYVIGGNPKDVNNANLLPTVKLVTEDPDGDTVSSNYLLFTYLRTDRAKNDPSTSIRVEWNTNLAGAWNSADGTLGEVIVEQNESPGLDRVKVYIPRPPTGTLFARLAVNVDIPTGAMIPE
jgi:hypothetical protein